MPPSSSESHSIVLLGTGDLTIEQVVAVARFGHPVAEIGGTTGNATANLAYARLLASRQWIQDEVQKENPRAVYGINTGFGTKVSAQALPKESIPQVARNLIVSHAAGVGEFLPVEVTRGAMLIRANSLAQGYSGVRPIIVNTLVRMLNRGVTPAIPRYGSLGSSGDLAPLAHLALALSKRPATLPLAEKLALGYEEESGSAFFNDQLLNAHKAMRVAQIELIELGEKEALALINGVAFSTALAALAQTDAENVVAHAEVATALALEALLGFRDAYLPQIHHIRRHKGQMESAQRIYTLTRESTLLDGDAELNPTRTPPQDAYSLRVAPQVIGAVRDVLEFTRATITNEINAATDNPLIFPDGYEPLLPRDYRAVSGGNFHGTPIGYAMDFVRIALTDLGGLCERQIFRLTDDKLNRGLPLMLVEDQKQGQTSGMMIAQYVAAALVSECKTLAHPDSVDSIPTSANQEDVVSMSMNAAAHTRTVVENISHVVAIGLLCGYMGLKWRLGHSSAKAGKGTQAALQAIESSLYSDANALPPLAVEPTIQDRYLRPYIVRVHELVKSGSLLPTNKTDGN